MRSAGTRPVRRAAWSGRVAEPPWEIRYKRSVAAELRRLDASLRRRIRAAIEERLAEDPRRGKRVRGLAERATGRPLWSLRVGDYRIIYVFSADELWVLVVKVGPRSGVYREYERQCRAGSIPSRGSRQDTVASATKASRTGDSGSRASAPKASTCAIDGRSDVGESLLVGVSLTHHRATQPPVRAARPSCRRRRARMLSCGRRQYATVTLT